MLLRLYILLKLCSSNEWPWYLSPVTAWILSVPVRVLALRHWDWKVPLLPRMILLRKWCTINSVKLYNYHCRTLLQLITHSTNKFCYTLAPLTAFLAALVLWNWYFWKIFVIKMCSILLFCASFTMSKNQIQVVKDSLKTICSIGVFWQSEIVVFGMNT